MSDSTQAPTDRNTLAGAVPDLSLVIPVYNEEKGLPDFLRRLDSACAKSTVNVEVFFVDDASSDASLNVLQEFVAKRNRMQLYRLAKNSGENTAVLVGFEHANAPVVVTMEAHAEHEISEVFRLHSLITDDVDIVSGVRVHRDAPGWRVGGSWLLNKILRALSVSPFEDLGFLLKAWRRDVGLRAFRHAHGGIEHGRLLVALQGYRVENTDVQCKPSGGRPSSYSFPNLFVGAIDVIVTALRIRFGILPEPTNIEATIPYELVNAELE